MVSRETVYGAFLDYYGDINVQLIKNEDGWAVYATKVTSGLNDARYIFVVVPVFGQPSESETLNNLDWVCFQTRTTGENYQVPSVSLFVDPKRKQALSDKIQVTERTKTETHYTTQLPIKIRLLHDPKKNNQLQYPDQALLYQALETYRCVIELL
jgi:hypothetical protein